MPGWRRPAIRASDPALPSSRRVQRHGSCPLEILRRCSRGSRGAERLLCEIDERSCRRRVREINRSDRRPHSEGSGCFRRLLRRPGGSVVVDENVDTRSCKTERDRSTDAYAATRDDSDSPLKFHTGERNPHRGGPLPSSRGVAPGPPILSVVSKEDPKLGRWILPVIVIALIGFTYLFVNALPPAEIPVGTTTTVAAQNTTTTAPETATTTTLPADIATFLQLVDSYAATANAIANNIDAANLSLIH